MFLPHYYIQQIVIVIVNQLCPIKHDLFLNAREMTSFFTANRMN